jgi:hypothetical protein
MRVIEGRGFRGFLQLELVTEFEMSLGEKFIGGGLARAYKAALDKYEDEREAKLTPEERQAELDESANRRWIKRLAEKQLSSDDPGYREALDETVRSLTNGEWRLAPAPLAVCECGVGITGGLHSDWCPLKGCDG